MAGGGGMAVLEVEDLRVWFPRPGDDRDGPLRAVDGVSFVLRRGETLAVVGESGCGKSTLAHALIGLVPPPGRCAARAIRLHTADGMVDIASLDPNGRGMRRVRGGQIGMVFQDAAASLSPARSVGSHLCEIIRLHRRVTRGDAERIAADLLGRVGVPHPERCLRAYVHELSGGLSQRVAIALALCGTPRILIADEPTTALDPLLRVQLLSLLRRLQAELEMAVLFITHDLGALDDVADEVAVMYGGQFMETASPRSLLAAPRHPYTSGLVDSMPRLGEARSRLPVIPGAVSGDGGSATRCAFVSRCDQARDECWTGRPAFVPVEPGHRVRCVLHGPTPQLP